MMNVRTRFQVKAESCGICLNLVSFRGKLSSCSHVFCIDCIVQWAETENSCPVCKERFISITKVAQRVDYSLRNRKRFQEEIIYVTHKDQTNALTHEEMLNLLELAERIFVEDLHNILDEMNLDE